MKYRLFVFTFYICTVCFSQHIEREHRIRKNQFPSLQKDAMLFVQETKQVRYYKEVDSLETTYLIKFKRDRLHYFLAYDANGKLKNSGFRIKEIDIPEDTAKKIKAYLSDAYGKSRIRRIYQQYPATNAESSLANTFQNLILPNNVYRLIVIGKNDQRNTEYDLWFSAEGNLTRKRQALPMNHDRVLY
ncbi:MAG: hypothetical protein HKP42_04905 [Maribacter sp.]|nr:hypothetical protein [Maribacter sp.]